MPIDIVQELGLQCQTYFQGGNDSASDTTTTTTTTTPSSGETKTTTNGIKVKYCTVDNEMVKASFNGVEDSNPFVCQANKDIIVDCTVGGGWVFCGTDKGSWGGYGVGPYLKVKGGTFTLLTSPNTAVWSGDESIGRFSIKHDGTSNEIVVLYGTRAD
jgi:hypothetical protein